jgi:hypothetical protein
MVSFHLRVFVSQRKVILDHCSFWFDVRLLSLFLLIMNIFTSVVPCVCVCISKMPGMNGDENAQDALVEASPLPL